MRKYLSNDFLGGDKIRIIIFVLIFISSFSVVNSYSIYNLKPGSYTDGIGVTNPTYAYDSDTSTAATYATVDQNANSIDYHTISIGGHTDAEKIYELNLSITIESTGLSDDLWSIQYTNDSGTNWYILRSESSQNLAKQTLTYNLSENWTWTKIQNDLQVRFTERKVAGKDPSTISIYDINLSVGSNGVPVLNSVQLDDVDTSDSGAYIDPTPGSFTNITCSAIGEDADGENDILGANATFYLNSVGSNSADDYNNHYTNSSCSIDKTYGTANQVFINCSSRIIYYSTPGFWQCNITIHDDMSNVSSTDASMAELRKMLAIDVTPLSLDFGNLKQGENTTTNYQLVKIKNVGNIDLDLNIEPYGTVEDDGYSMVCTSGNISDSFLRYDALATFTNYDDFTPAVSGTGTDITNFNLPKQTSGTLPTEKEVRFGLGIPYGVSGICSGNIIMTALEDK